MIKRITELANNILHHKRAYYSGHPEISDNEYDALEDELRRLSPQHPVLSIVGVDAPASEARKSSHLTPMLSLEKTYDPDDLKSWLSDRVAVGTVKIDGNSLSLVYRDGVLQVAKTRGNGRIGEEVTEKIRWIADIPQVLPAVGAGKVSASGVLEVRGELYCSESSFVALADEMVQLGLERPSNPRNIVAGLLGRKQHIELCRHFGFFAFDLLPPDVQRLPTETLKFKRLAELGFSLPDHKTLFDFHAVQNYLAHIKELMELGEIGIDGAVFTYDDIKLHAELGVTSHHPRYKLSFKWQGQTARSVIREIVWQTSRLGVVTPVAVIDPVELSGAQITNITLHNAAHVKGYNLKIGDEIELVRSGEVIPKFLSVIQSAAGTAECPRTCPSCDAPLSFDDVRLHCSNSAKCPAQQIGVILNWIKAVDVEDLSEKRLASLIAAQKVARIPDLYRLREGDFLVIPQTKEKMAAKLFANIQKSRNVPLAAFLNGLGIHGAGRATWEAILALHPDLSAVRKLSAAELCQIDGFAEKSAEQIIFGLKEKSALIDELLSVGVVPFIDSTESEDHANGILAGKAIAITGTLSRARNEIEADIKAAGGKVAESVSRNTFALVIADPQSSSSKAKKARDAGVRLWSEQDLMRVIAGSGANLME